MNSVTPSKENIRVLWDFGGFSLDVFLFIGFNQTP